MDLESINIINKIKNLFYINLIDERIGQLSLEFLLTSLVAILIFITISLPFAGIAIDSTFDIHDSLSVKSEISKINQGINEVYSNGAGSKRTIFIESPKDININFYKDTGANNGGYAITDITLSDGSIKTIKVFNNADNLESSIHLNKKTNTRVIIEWSQNSQNIIVRV